MKRSKLEHLIYIFCSRYLLLAICHVLFVDLLWFKRVCIFNLLERMSGSFLDYPYYTVVGGGEGEIYPTLNQYNLSIYLYVVLSHVCFMQVWYVCKKILKGGHWIQVYIIGWKAAWNRRALKSNLDGALWISSLCEIVGDRLHRLFTWYHN